VFYPNGCYKKTANLRIRPIPEMQACVVFTPDTPNLYTLNPTAWLVMALCDGRAGKALESAYYDTVEPLVTRRQAAAELRRTLADLQQKGIVKHHEQGVGNYGKKYGKK
jgi:Coenzyme PQQ synthesis protein D (PqqD)